jgi:hypothetical protein
VRAKGLPQYSSPIGIAGLGATFDRNEVFGDLPTNPQATFNWQNMFKAKSWD